MVSGNPVMKVDIWNPLAIAAAVKVNPPELPPEPDPDPEPEPEPGAADTDAVAVEFAPW